MRNLKRAFSLVLALVMVLSVMTIAPVAAADETTTTVTSNFTDAAEINPDYMQAVAITGGIGLFAGADGKFMPKGTVTRAQMATIIVKMLYGDANADSFKGSGKFIDTAYFEGGWAEGYINWCATLGIVAGYGDGTFKPGNQVTTAEAATMILNALKIDAGEGTWPNTVMAKGEEEDLFEDLKPMPGTNTALTREELAVIALNGLNWTPTDETGWYVSGGTADEKMTFESYKDAATYASKVGGQVQPLEGRDSLANKVYELKKATGFITANQATGEKYTEVTLDWAGPATAKFNVVTDAKMIGHKVEVWYQETYTSEREPGVTYAVSEAAEYITLTEDAENAKEYKAAFGTKYDLPAGGIAGTNGTGYVSGGVGIPGYVANSFAPAGTYAIDLETGELCGYIAPAAYTIAKVGYVDTTPENEMILVGSLSLSNTAEDDEVVEYDGIAKDDYVVYFRMQDVYVLAKMEMVTGKVTKVATEDGKKVVTLDGDKEYTQSTAAGSITNTLTAADLGSVNYEEIYTFYLDPNGDFVCYEVNEGGSFDMANTFYVLGVMSRDETDSYGKSTTTYFARGIDMTGNEAMVPIGVTTPSGDYGDKTIAENDTFYSVEDNNDSKETKEYGLKKLVGFPGAYNADDPTATYTFKLTSYGQTGADWQPGGQFEYGVAEQLANNGTFEAGVYCYNHKGTKYIVVEGSATQAYPLETAVFTGSATFKFAKQTDIRVLVTRQANGTNNIEAMVLPMNVDHGVNATMIYVDKDHTLPTGTDTVGNVYEVHDALTGEAMEITLSTAIASIPVGFYSIGYDADEELYKLAVDGSGVPIKVPAASSETYFEQRYRDDGRYFESVVYDTAPTAYTGSIMWYNVSGSVWNSSASGTKVVDPRSDEQIAKDGVARITTLDQVWAMKDSMPWVNIELDMCHTYSPSKIATVFVEVYNNRDYGMDNLVYAYDYGATEVTVITGQLHGMGDVIDLPAGVTAGQPGFYYLATGGNGAVMLIPASAADMGTTAGVAFSTGDLPAYDVQFNATKLDIATIFNYDVVEYQTMVADGQTILLVTGAGDAADTGLTIEAPVDANDFDSVVDTTANGITLANLNTKQDEMCIEYTTYAMADGRVMFVVDSVDAGTEIRTANALNAITAADVVNNTTASFTTLAQLKDLVSSGYTFVAKKYDVGGSTKLVVSLCMNATVAGTTLNGASFATDSVQLSGDTTVAGTITVPAGETWTLDLAGNTLSGSVSTYFDVDGTLIVMDSASGGTIKGNSNATAAMFVVSGKLVLNGGKLTGQDTSATAGPGAAVYIEKNATFEMNGGEISGNAAKRGAGVTSGDVPDSGVYFTMTGGVIENNEGAERGGNFYFFAPAMVTLSGNAVVGAATRNNESATIGTYNAEVRGGNLTVTGGTYEQIGLNRTGGAGVGLVSATISGNPVIKLLTLDVTASGTYRIGSLTTGANVTTDNNDALTVLDDTVDHTAATKVYTASSGVLTVKAMSAVGGTVAVSAAAATAGTEIIVTATPDAGYELVEILVDGEVISGNTFNVSKHHKVSAVFAAIDYNVVKGAETNGTFTVDPTTANVGDTITVTTAPASGYEVLSVKVNGSEAGVTDNRDGTYTFTMPAEEVTVDVAFDLPSYTITKADATNGTVAVSANKAVAGTEITITATPNEGYEVDTIAVSGGVTVTDGKFTMPAEDVTVTVTFKVEVPNTVTADNFVSGQTLTLTKNSKLDASITLAAGTYTLDLNGFTLSGVAAPYFTLDEGATLTIKDSSNADTGTIRGITAADVMIKVKKNATMNLEGGTLTGHASSGVHGSAIGVPDGSAGAAVNISGGAIINNTSTGKGGAISMGDGGASNLTITGGTISGNTSTNSSNNYDIYSHTGTLTIEDGTIGGAYWRYGTTNVTGGKITMLRTGAKAGTSYALNISGDSEIGSLMLDSGYQDADLNIKNLTAGASITLELASYASSIKTDDTVKVDNKVYTFKG